MKDNNKTKNQIIDKTNLLKGIIAGLILVAIFFSGYFTHYFSINKELRSIEFLLDVYKEHYFEKSDKSIVHTIAEGILDDYSGYYTAEEYKAYLKQGEGSQSGYGIAMRDLTVLYTVGNSPAERCGIKNGGKIVGYKVKQNSDYITATTQEEFSNFLKAEQGEICLKIDYDGDIKEFTLKREEYIENNVYYTDSTGSYRFEGDENSMNFVSYEGENIQLESGWAYLKLVSFNGLKDGTLGGAGQFAFALEKFKQNGNTKLIIDLRSNGGGYMSILCEIATHLCADTSGKEFVCQKASYSDGKVSVFKAKESSYQRYNFESIVFLANSGSASASEALMGAVLDYDKASGNNLVKVIVEPVKVGEQTVYKTYGKGIMQATYSNSLTGEAVKLTTAKVIWPISGTCIHGVGLTPELDQRIYANTFGDAIAYAQTLG